MNQPLLKPITILMADDDADDCFLVQEAFKENHLLNDIRFVSNGEELLDYLYHRNRYENPTDSPTPGLILLDLNMPRMDGREALREIKSDPRTRCIPIVVLTTSEDEKDIWSSYGLGANSFITKPVEFRTLLDMISSLGRYWLEIVELPPAKEGCGHVR